MHKEPEPGSEPAKAQPGLPKAVTMRSRVAAQQRERRLALITGSGILIAMTLGAGWALTIEANRSRVLLAASASTATGPLTDVAPTTAKITDDRSGTCSTGAFDNKTGRVTRSNDPCDTILRDSNGVPIPAGTIHRLDAISKSFSGR
jgi:hypothetical protein